MRRLTNKLLSVLFICICVSVLLIGAADSMAGGRLILLPDGTYDAPAFAEYVFSDDKTTATAVVFGIPIKTVNVSELSTMRVIPGGQSFGVKLKTHGVQIAGFGTVETADGVFEPGRKAGLSENDIIVSVNGEDVLSCEEFVGMIKGCKGNALRLVYRRRGIEQETELLPVADKNGEYRSGIWVKDSVAGIGTVTYIIPEGSRFGGLGHGICETETGEILPFYSGEVYDAYITGINPGKVGEPGELRGYFGRKPTGSVTANEESGVFGIFDGKCEGKTVDIALKNKVREGAAKMLCTLDGSGVGEYDVQITCILSKESQTKNFIVRITDKELLAKTGGIVQGMSGSPILQKGKLVGAVTHVLVNDPTRGYGIFIENMLVNSE